MKINNNSKDQVSKTKTAVVHVNLAESGGEARQLDQPRSSSPRKSAILADLWRVLTGLHIQGLLKEPSDGPI